MYNNIPAPDAIPVNWLWFQGLLMLTFVLHLIMMNLVLGGSLIAIWDNVIKKRKFPGISNLPIVLALTINLGVPPLLFVQVLYGHMFYTSSIIMALPWLLVVPILILAYYGSYIYVKNIDRAPIWARTGLIISALFLLYVGFMYVNNSTLAINPANWDKYFENSGGTRLNLGEPSIWPRYLHFIVAALSVASLAIAFYAKISLKDSPEERDKIIGLNMKRFAWLSLIQFAMGTWFWLSNPKDVWMVFMGGNIVATAFMIISWLMAISMVVSAFRKKINATLIHVLVIIVFMVFIREFLRAAWLKDIFTPRSLEVANKISPFIAFLVVFVAGIFIIYYMYRLATEKPEKS